MIISILTDNHPGRNTPAEHGLSYLIEFDGKRLLFDTGQSNLFLKNAETMGIDMTMFDAFVLRKNNIPGRNSPYNRFRKKTSFVLESDIPDFVMDIRNPAKSCSGRVLTIISYT